MSLRHALVVALAAVWVAILFTWSWWDTVVDLDARHRKYDQIQEGMTLAEVEAAMGEAGEPRPLKISGDYSELNFPNLLRWQDAYLTVDVMFGGGWKGKPNVVTYVTRTPKEPYALGLLWCQRVFLLALWLFGPGLLLWRWRASNPAVALNSSGAPDTTNGAGSPARTSGSAP